MAYITVSGLKTYSDFVGSTDDALLSDLISNATVIIETYTQRTFEAVAGVRYFDAVEDIDDEYLYLDEDLAQITAVINGDSVTVTSSDYVTEPRNETPYFALKLKGSSSKNWTYSTDPENAISVSGYWGYSLSAPYDIQQAAYRLASWLYKQRETDVDLDRPMLTQDGVTIMPAKIPSDVQSMLNPYRKLRVWGSK